ncbi:hypothetical protein [Candidatus Spongiihabitans sp.]|uniref:hypothetical protein n=1 Tax=Candidatus Spongiihabitans sp. TaxID=3101308 RepID=UPI003C7D9AF0
MPGPYYYWPGNPVIKLSGVSRYCAATPRLDSRLPARMTAGRAIFSACGENDGREDA